MPKKPDFRSLPSVERLALDSALSEFKDRVRRVAARGAVASARSAMLLGKSVDEGQILKDALTRARGLSQASLRSAINMSGVVLHTGLGRAQLAEEAVRQIAEVAASHSVLEFDDEFGGRGNRQDHVRVLLRELTGAEDALVVNNGAAAVVLALNALCAGREVLLSRGQMVEIGGSFRLPDIVRHSGCSLVEVGCTNKTRVEDYRLALTKHTGALLRCHPSNFQIVGFAEEPTAPSLAEFCKENGLSFIDDIGSGCVIDTSKYGLAHERTLGEAIQNGADVVTASGDKLLGGPQAGLILGRSEHIERISRHPLARAFRIDKLSLAGLEATLRLYLNGRHEEIPVWRTISRPIEEVRRLADIVAKGREGAIIEQGWTEVGGGSLPGVTVPTFRVGLPGNAADMAISLRACKRPVVGYIQDGLFWLDPRSADEEECLAVASFLMERTDG